MKITKSQLKQIIKEELVRLIEGAAKEPDIDFYLQGDPLYLMPGIAQGHEYDVMDPKPGWDDPYIVAKDEFWRDQIASVMQPTAHYPNNPLRGTRYEIIEGDPQLGPNTVSWR